jgi:hypothetical protein
LEGVSFWGWINPSLTPIHPCIVEGFMWGCLVGYLYGEMSLFCVSLPHLLVSCSIRGGTYIGVLGNWRRPLSSWSLGPCDIYLRGWTLDLRMLGLRSKLHGGGDGP